MTGTSPSPATDPLSAAEIRRALDRHPEASVLVLPRRDGQYSGMATDVLGLLEEAGVAADYATDPMAAGVHIEESADIILPFLLIVAQAIGTAGDISMTIDGIIATVRWISQRRSTATVELNPGVTKRPNGEEVRTLQMTIGPGALDERSERTVRDAIDQWSPSEFGLARLRDGQLGMSRARLAAFRGDPKAESLARHALTVLRAAIDGLDAVRPSGVDDRAMMHT